MLKFEVLGAKQAAANLRDLAQVLRIEARAEARLLAEGLADGMRRRMPVDTGTARDAIVVIETERGFDVTFDTDVVTAASGDNFFYPAVIEYGSEALNRPPVAPGRRTLDEDGPRLIAEALRRLNSKVTS